MAELDDHQLLAQFARENSGPAFAALVQRHVNLVYSAARRHSGNDHAAEEITQAVFIILARKAGRLSPQTVLSGWLWQTVRLTAANHLRAEARRARREQEAFMQSQINEPQTGQTWQAIAPLLDDALDRLGERDRDAIVLRFFENKNLRDVGHALGASEDAAKMRVNRALEKLRKIFTKHGVTLSAAAIAGAVGTHSVQAAPAGLAKTVSTVAMTKGATVATSILPLVKGALNLMAWTKAKTTIVVVAVVLLAAGTTVVGVKEINLYKNRDSWRSARLTWQQVGETAPQVRIIPTKFRPPVTHMLTSNGIKWGGVRVSVREILRAAYRVSPGRVVFPDGEPQEKYDFISTLSHGTEEALQRELKKTLGLAGRWETRDTDALALRVRNPDAAGLMPAFWMPDESGDLRGGHIHCFGEGLAWTPHLPPWGLTKFLEMIFQMPVVDGTGLTGNFNLDLRWKVKADPGANQAALKQALLDQLGLELVSTNLPVEILVVEKTK